eukprot:CAMPEP_0170746122 /NCGR_PEP_ID=MMETSP0437-20130122/8646_1 /TAXON_ID=0 /ORGANISM="Sexangularia sp." /LENGTH=392 /DNA_ID=CAMNT_0011084863 /DNA_START=305 /DNA_END=1482 /DNA_ORIENTATION=-
MSEGGEVVLCFGSALGAWRSGGAMSWDRDVDVCVSQQFLTRLLERERTEQSLANTGFALVDQRGPRGVRDDVIGARLVHTTTDFYIDLWSLHEAQVRTADQVVPLLCTGDSSFLFADIAFTRQPDAIASFTDGKLAPIRSPEEELFATSPDGSKRWPRRMCLPRSWYFPSVNCSYDNIPGVQCPAHVHEVLAARYGQPLTAPSAWTYCYPTFYSWQGLGRALTAVAVFHWILPRLLQPRKRARAPWLNGHRVAAILACAVTVLYVEVAPPTVTLCALAALAAAASLACPARCSLAVASSSNPPTVVIASASDMCKYTPHPTLTVNTSPCNAFASTSTVSNVDEPTGMSTVTTSPSTAESSTNDIPRNETSSLFNSATRCSSISIDILTTRPM